MLENKDNGAAQKAAFVINIPAEEEGGKSYSCKLSKPTRAVIEHVLAMAMPMNGEKPNLIAAGGKVLASCWIEGDEEIKTDDELNIAACMQALSIVKMREASIAKI